MFTCVELNIIPEKKPLYILPNVQFRNALRFPIPPCKSAIAYSIAQ